MSKTYFEPTSYKSLSNKDLLKKQEEIGIKISKAQSGFIPADLVDTMLEMQKQIDAEVDARLDDGRMNEDELDEDF